MADQEYQCKLTAILTLKKKRSNAWLCSLLVPLVLLGASPPQQRLSYFELVDNAV